MIDTGSCTPTGGSWVRRRAWRRANAATISARSSTRMPSGSQSKVRASTRVRQARGDGQRRLRQGELEVLAPPRKRAEVGVSDRVRADVVARGHLAADEPGVRHDLGADHEEGGGDVLLPQEVEELGCPRGIRTV